jgi:prepilin peptidase CpaA
VSWEILVVMPPVLAAVAEDLWRRQISNWIPLSAFLAGLAMQAIDAGWRGLGWGLLGAACGFAVFLVFYVLGGMGGGDVKLMAGVGAALGPVLLVKAALWVAAAGGVWALAVLGYRRLAWSRGDAQKAWAEPIPYAPAIGIGVALALVEKL